jgi:glycosyltransferase involved in cell wall biosynthesis
MAQGFFGRAAAAIGLGSGSIVSGPSQSRALGDQARDRGDWAAAVEHYRSFLRADPSSFPIWVQLGHASKESGDLSSAEEAYRRAESIDPSDSDLALNLGHLMKSLHRRGEAERYYARSFNLDGSPAARAELEALGVTPERDLAARKVHEDKPMVGSIDRADGLEIRGWAVERDSALGPAKVEVVSEGRIIGTGVATQHRADVAAAGYGDGLVGFTVFIDAEDLAGETIIASVRLQSTGDALDGSPLTIALPTTDETEEALRITAARYVFAKPLVSVSGEHAIFVAYAPTGMVQPFVRRFLRMLSEQGISVSLVVNADRPVLLDDELLGLVACALVRENKGYDFGAWAHLLRLEPALYGADALYILNDSIFGPSDPKHFAETIDKVRANPADFVGLTESLERGWHVQSYFMRASAALLSSYAFQIFVNEIRVVPDKDELINAFEVPLTQRVCASGYTADAVFKVDEARNPTLFSWRRLIASGYPFVKLLLVRGRFPHVDTLGIDKVLRRAGFDQDLLDATLAYRTEEPQPAPGYPLLARPLVSRLKEGEPARKPYKVAFYGPWNYDNGLGSASRGIIAGIRNAGVRLNLHPIHKPFHVHKQMTPPHDVIDFDGAADVAIVHLNPDSWHLLTDEQRADIARARRRIGYWVWEMEHLPKAWRRDFSSVDRIWAPSGYNATLFAEQDEAPVDVVPHVVPVDLEPVGNRAPIREALSLPTDRRLILYVFDGASYLVRKNPAALVRAFAASKLGEQDWSLVLKTKHLMDRPGDGRELATLAGETEGVILLDRSLSSRELSDLVAACDIYASPHCAEGFGLTVAEAMAAGRVVVATDYSGTTQFLDASCGFPVTATSWTLGENFGHYTKGGTWAKIDEEALANALTLAAKRIDAGDTSIGDAARQRIADVLSIEAVAARITKSLDAVLTDTKSVRRPPARIEEGARGVPLSAFEPGAILKPVPLKEGSLSPRSDALEDVEDSRDSWAMFAPEDGGLHPLTRRIFERHAAARPDVSLFYGDDAAFGEATLLDQIRLKPQFDQTLFAAQDYIGAPLFVRGSALHELGGVNNSLGNAALYDLVLRAAEHGMSIGRIPEVLSVRPGERVLAPAAARRTLIERSPLYAGYAVSPCATPETLRLAARFGDDRPHVTICVPTRRTTVEGGEGTYIERLLTSIADVDWPAGRLTVIVADDIPGTPGWEHDDWPFALRRIETLRGPEEPFNFAAKVNTLWRAAESEIVMITNDDVVALDRGWMAALAGFAMDRDVGAVGPRLLYDDGTIQHAGIYGGVLGTSVHAWLGRRPGAATYQDWAVTQREVSMITGALIATRRSVLEAVNGVDERFSLEFNDIDLCLKIRQLGLRIVYNPAAELIHSEKKSRGDSVPPGEQLALFLSRWQDWLSDDPALPPRMRRDMLDLTPSAGRGDWFV